MVVIERPDVQLLYKATEVHLRMDKKDAAEIVNLCGRLKPGVEYDIDIRERAKRSLNANAYYWTLVEKIANANGISKYEAHNHLMIDYGTDWIDEDGKRIYVMMKDNDRYLRSQTMHYRPTDATEDRKGTTYRWFVLLKPSHLMNAKEMNALITGCVSECHELDIETRTPEEIARLIQTWEARDNG